MADPARAKRCRCGLSRKTTLGCGCARRNVPSGAPSVVVADKRESRVKIAERPHRRTAKAEADDVAGAAREWPPHCVAPFATEKALAPGNASRERDRERHRRVLRDFDPPLLR